MNPNFNKRKNRRFRYESVIWHDNIVPGRFYAARIGNISSAGIYFESNQSLYKGEKISIGSQDPQVDDNKIANRTDVEIKWRRELKNSRFRFGYGAGFLAADNPLLRSIQKGKLIRPATDDTQLDGRRQDPREYLRESCCKEILLVSENRTGRGRIMNMSRGGALIDTEIKFSLGQLIKLLIAEDINCREHHIQGWVVRLTPQGIGVRFDRRAGRDRRKNSDRRTR